MTEVWLHPNRRALGMGLIVPAILLASAAAWWLLWNDGLWRWLAAVPIVLAILLAAGLTYHLRQPRLAYGDDHLLAYLGNGRPYRIPIELVEVFFLGQVEDESTGRTVEAKSIVIRLAERAEDWKQQPVKPSLGRWCDGYVTIRGLWCEPITPEVLQGLNRRLVEAHRRQKAATQSS